MPRFPLAAVGGVWAGAVALAACSAGPPAPAPGVTPVPASPVVAQPAPGAAILGAADVGLPVAGAADGITAAQAANDVPDAADALPLFDSWGWVVESRRHFARNPAASVDVTVLLTLRESGAEAAFAFLSEQSAVPPLIAGACPGAVVGLDQCALGEGGGRVLVVGRFGTEVFEIATVGADAERLASLQAARLRG